MLALEIWLLQFQRQLTFANCKFQLYRITADTPVSQINLLPYLKDAEEYVNKAIQLTHKDYKFHLANQYRLLGHIHSQLAHINKSTEERAQDHLTRARECNPEIRINTFILPELRAHFSGFQEAYRAHTKTHRNRDL